jgi:CHAD domain-containing protein
MLSRKRQRKFLSANEKEFLRQLKAYRISGNDEESLHRLRLSIKKIKALTVLSKACAIKAPLKDFRLLEDLFSLSGQIRDSNSSLLYWEKYRLITPEERHRQIAFMASPSDKLLAGKKAFLKKGNKAGRLLQQDVRAISNRGIRIWYAGQLIHIGVLLAASGDQLHQARKKIKSLLYVHKILPDRVIAALQLNPEYLDCLQDAIGQWHDIVMAMSGRDNSNPSGQVMMQECRNKEAAVHDLANDYYRKVHRQPLSHSACPAPSAYRSLSPAPV